MPNNCHSCHLYSRQNLSLVEKNEWHHLTCMQGHGGREITIRHNQVVATIERFAKLAGATVVTEPKNLFIFRKLKTTGLTKYHESQKLLIRYYHSTSYCTIQ